MEEEMETQAWLHNFPHVAAFQHLPPAPFIHKQLPIQRWILFCLGESAFNIKRPQHAAKKDTLLKHAWLWRNTQKEGPRIPPRVVSWLQYSRTYPPPPPSVHAFLFSNALQTLDVSCWLDFKSSARSISNSESQAGAYIFPILHESTTKQEQRFWPGHWKRRPIEIPRESGWHTFPMSGYNNGAWGTHYQTTRACAQHNTQEFLFS